MRNKKRTSKIPLINVCWLVTSKCNYNCSFCFNVYNRRELYYNEAVEILKKLAEYGVMKVSFSGGEPLLWSGIRNLIKLAKSYGLITMLITNGSLITKKDIREFSGALDWITLPLDSSSERGQQKAGRPKGHFTRVIKLLKLLKESPIKVKINTVLSKKSIDGTEKLVDIVEKYNVQRWKIFQFFPIRSAALENKDKYLVSSNEFQETKKKILALVKNKKVSIYFASNALIERSYFILAPDGTVYVSKNGNDYLIGDLKNQGVKEIWERNRFISKRKYWDRSRWLLKTEEK